MDEIEWNETQWDIIDKFFNENRYCLVDHHLKSYNKFYENDIFNIFREKNPVKILKEYNSKTSEYDLQCYMYMGGKSGKKFIMENLLFLMKKIHTLCFQMKHDLEI